MAYHIPWSFVASIIYTAAWSISFYGQVYQNYKLKSVEGFSLDYLSFNITGYTLYTIYSSIGYFTQITGAGTVVVADLIFTYHAIMIVSLQVVQCAIYPVLAYAKQSGANRISKYTVGIIIAIWGIVLGEVCAGAVQELLPWQQYWNPVIVMGYGKLLISLLKYTPAVYWNYKRKSTKGWSIFNIILDLVGGIFSFASGGLSAENGLNLTKVILAFLTVFYDIIFIIQHYCIYPKKKQAPTYEVISELRQ